MDEVTQKRHNTADTSKETFIAISNEGKLIEEKKLVYEAIKRYGPITSRQLVTLIKRERGNITRSIYDLLNEINPSIKIGYKQRCPTTKRKVKWYVDIHWKPTLFQ